jgi:hypothetical protein
MHATVCITGYIYRGSRHVKKPVNNDDKRDAFYLQFDLFKNNGSRTPLA